MTLTNVERALETQQLLLGCTQYFRKGRCAVYDGLGLATSAEQEPAEGRVAVAVFLDTKMTRDIGRQ